MIDARPDAASAPARRSLAVTLGLWLAWLAYTSLGALALAALLPDLPGYSTTGLSQSLLLVWGGVILLTIVLASCRWWQLAGFVEPSRWRQRQLLWVPAALLLLPLLPGTRPVSAGTAGLLLAGYLATGFVEEGLFRGVILGLLRPRGLWYAVLISSALFGLAHLGNALLRGVSIIVVWQAIGAATGGVGWAALRLRTGTVWPLILLHALHDFSLQLGTLPIPLIDAVFDVVLLAYGLFLLRHGAPPAQPSREPAMERRADTDDPPEPVGRRPATVMRAP